MNAWRHTTRVALLVAAACVAAGDALAQGAGAPPGGDRGRLEQQVRERLATVVQQRLRLTDAQMVRLRQTNARFEPRRRELVQQERELRLELRREVLADSAANQAHVAQLVDRAIDIQRQRLNLVDAEQKDLAQFLSPVQRARYLDLQEKFRQRVEQLRRDQQLGGRGRGGGGGGGGGRGALQGRGRSRP